MVGSLWHLLGRVQEEGASCFRFVFLLQYKLQQKHVADGAAGDGEEHLAFPEMGTAG